MIGPNSQYKACPVKLFTDKQVDQIRRSLDDNRQCPKDFMRTALQVVEKTEESLRKIAQLAVEYNTDVRYFER